jgi:hypothetical protein
MLRCRIRVRGDLLLAGEASRRAKEVEIIDDRSIEVSDSHVDT